MTVLRSDRFVHIGCVIGVVALVALAAPAAGVWRIAAADAAINWSIQSYIHRYCYPSEGASRSDYSGGTQYSYMSTRGQLFKYYNNQWYFAKEDTAFSGRGPSGTARVAPHATQAFPLLQQGKHVSTFDMSGTTTRYTSYQDNAVCA